jgi:hypothetical protein
MWVEMPMKVVGLRAGGTAAANVKRTKTMIALVNILETSLKTALVNGGVKTVFQY